MRARHVARLCRSCQADGAPRGSVLACGAPWVSDYAPRAALRVIEGGGADSDAALTVFPAVAANAVNL